MRSFVLASAILPVIATAAIAQHEAYIRSEPRDLVREWHRQDNICRGTYDQTVSQPACRSRDVLDKRLAKVGWCFGLRGQLYYQYRWHRCGRGSLRD